METRWQDIIKSCRIPVFDRNNLTLILGENRRTLDTRLSSLVRRGLLVSIKKGIYLNKYMYDSSSDKGKALEYIGSMLVFPSYLSLEYILAEKGILAESVNAFTYVTTKKTRKFETDVGVYIYRSVKDVLFSDYEERLYNGLKFNVAKTYKALFDFVYFIPIKSTSEMKALLLDSRLNWNALNKEDKDGFVKFTTGVGIPKMLKVLSVLKKEKIL